MSSLLVNELYTPLDLARRELMSRREDASLRTAIAEWSSSLPPPEPLDTSPRLVYAPSIISPNLELLHLLNRAPQLGMPLHLYEYAHDKFVHMNYVKRCLGHLSFVDTSDTRSVIAERRIVDFQIAQGKYMDEIETLEAENFVSFHHRLLREAVTGPIPPISDFSSWFARSKLHNPHLPYARFLGLFLSDAILLANFTTEKHESFFTEQVVLPAFRHLREKFGVKPLIVPVAPVDSDDSPVWNYYPEKLMSCV